MRVTRLAALGFALVLLVLPAARVTAQPPTALLDQLEPELHTRLVGIERAIGVCLGALMRGRDSVVEGEVLAAMTRRIDSDAQSPSDREAERGYAALGVRAAAVIARAQAFHRAVLAVFASVPAPERRRALEALVARYRSEPAVALPDAPKDMTVLYDHSYTSFVPPRPGETEPRRELPFPRVTGLVWASYWYQLAAQEALEAPAGAERERALATVAERYQRKRSASAPPDGYPTELPLAPSIAPGLVAVHEGSAAIVDNLHMLLDVLADTLAHAAVRDRRAAAEAVVAQFLDRRFRCVQTDEWITVALRHSIFEQGGPALGAMAANERNAFFGAHAQHFGPRRTPPPCDPE